MDESTIRIRLPGPKAEMWPSLETIGCRKVIASWDDDVFQLDHLGDVALVDRRRFS